jgi:hypothetical protein
MYEGKTPANFEVDAGMYIVRASLGGQTLEKTVTVNDGQHTRCHFDFSDSGSGAGSAMPTARAGIPIFALVAIALIVLLVVVSQ